MDQALFCLEERNPREWFVIAYLRYFSNKLRQLLSISLEGRRKDFHPQPDRWSLNVQPVESRWTLASYGVQAPESPKGLAFGLISLWWVWKAAATCFALGFLTTSCPEHQDSLREKSLPPCASKRSMSGYLPRSPQSSFPQSPASP